MNRKYLFTFGLSLCLLLTSCSAKDSASQESSSLPETDTVTTSETAETSGDEAAETSGAESTETSGAEVSGTETTEPAGQSAADTTDAPSGSNSADEGRSCGAEKLFDSPEDAIQNTSAVWNELNADRLMQSLSPRIVKGLADSYGLSVGEVYAACKDDAAKIKEDADYQILSMKVTRLLSRDDLNNENDADQSTREYITQIYDILTNYGYDAESVSCAVADVHVFYFDAEGVVTGEDDIMEPVFRVDEGWFDPWTAAIVEMVLEE